MMSFILVVDDEANIRKFAAVNLTARGYKVVEAGSAEQALEQLRGTPPTVLLLDIKLPSMSGWDLLDIMAGDPHLKNIPVIVMTASAYQGSTRAPNYNNVVEVLAKPINANALVGAVQKALV